MSLDAFCRRFNRRLERDPATGRFGRYLDGLGRWAWWDLDGRFDGHIIGDPKRREGRSVSQVSSVESQGRAVLANLEDAFRTALGLEPDATWPAVAETVSARFGNHWAAGVAYHH